MPQSSKRTGSQVSGAVAKNVAAKTKASDAKGSTKATGNGSPRSGPVDPRTEDPSAPNGLSRAGKALWRRPGALAPRTTKQHQVGGADAPIDFSVAMPLAPVAPDPPAALVGPAVPELVIAVEPAALAPTVESAPPPKSDSPTMLVPTEPDPTVVVPAELQPEPAVTLPAPILYDQAATIDDVTQIGPVLESRPLLRPIQFRRAPKPRVRRVTRVVRHVDTWSVFKVAMVFSVFFYAVALVAGVLLWQVAYATGTIDNVEKFFEGFGWETFKFNGGQIYHNAWIAGLFVAVGMTGLAVLMATLFNLITDLVGGIRLSVLEEEVRSRAERGTEPAATAAEAPQPEPTLVQDFSMVSAEVMPTDEVLPVESDSARPVA